jgi:hypothetical protein
MLKISMECTRFEVVTLVVHVGAVKVYVAAVEALRKKERQGQNQIKLSLAQKVVHFWVWHPVEG